ncbi:hypothetical protein [Lacisediminihabitans sp. H27-G8]|uniref:hypothetical protein n=1 Tax=Lacisediminihabitans sp. H27-G8 TaxID=3111909 RepID=UPI0038FD3A85
MTGNQESAKARAKAREWQQRWRAANPELIKKYRLNERERRAEYQAANPEKFRQDRRDYEQRRQEHLKAQDARRTQNRQRAKDWAAANPERARAKGEEWNERNPGRIRELKRNYYQRNSEERKRAAREQNTRRRQDSAQRQREREYQAAQSDVRSTGQRVRRADPELRDKLNQEQNERRRRERRRRQLGLPPRRPHRATINARAENKAAASAFFSRRHAPSAMRALLQEQAEVRAATALISDAFWAAELAAQIRADTRRPARIAALTHELLATVEGAQLREEVRMDSLARARRGAQPYPNLEAEARRRALAALTIPRTPVRDGNATPATTRPKFGTFVVGQRGTRAVQPSRGLPAI